jgi:hypothetical protein
MLKTLTYNENISLPITTKHNFNVIVMSDFHVGSRYGYLPREVTAKNGTPIVQSKEQRLMEKGLHDQLNKVGNIDVLILDGDLCEGKQIKIAGIDLSDSDTDTTVKWATNSIENIISITKPSYIVIVKGTDYHVTNAIGGDLDYQVASALSGTHVVYYGLPVANVRIGNMLWRISHRYPTTRNITPPMETFLKELISDAHIKQYRVPDVFVWAHTHQCIEPHRILSTSSYGMVSPAQKLNDPYIDQSYYSKRPDIGFIHVEQDGDYLNGRFIRTYKV